MTGHVTAASFWVWSHLTAVPTRDAGCLHHQPTISREEVTAPTRISSVFLVHWTHVHRFLAEHTRTSAGPSAWRGTDWWSGTADCRLLPRPGFRTCFRWGSRSPWKHIKPSTPVYYPLTQLTTQTRPASSFPRSPSVPPALCFLFTLPLPFSPFLFCFLNPVLWNPSFILNIHLES